jgi:hypothetical protein
MVSLAATAWGWACVGTGLRPVRAERRSAAVWWNMVDSLHSYRKACRASLSLDGSETRPHTVLAGLLCHGYFYILVIGKLLRLFVSRVRVPNDPHPGIGGQHTFDSLGHHVGSVSNQHLSGVQ